METAKGLSKTEWQAGCVVFCQVRGNPEDGAAPKATTSRTTTLIRYQTTKHKRFGHLITTGLSPLKRGPRASCEQTLDHVEAYQQDGHPSG